VVFWVTRVSEENIASIFREEALNLEAAGSSEIVVITHQATRCTEDNNNLNRRKNIRSLLGNSLSLHTKVPNSLSLHTKVPNSLSLHTKVTNSLFLHTKVQCQILRIYPFRYIPVAFTQKTCGVCLCIV
jgi:hypothetical protein